MELPSHSIEAWSRSLRSALLCDQSLVAVQFHLVVVLFAGILRLLVGMLARLLRQLALAGVLNNCSRGQEDNLPLRKSLHRRCAILRSPAFLACVFDPSKQQAMRNSPNNCGNRNLSASGPSVAAGGIPALWHAVGTQQSFHLHAPDHHRFFRSIRHAQGFMAARVPAHECMLCVGVSSDRCWILFFDLA